MLLSVVLRLEFLEYNLADWVAPFSTGRRRQGQMPIAMNEVGKAHGSDALLANQLPVLQAGHFLFTSESVGEGHPGTAPPSPMDKLCDQISDAILDACLTQDPLSRVACETAAMTGMIVVFGEITSKAVVDFQTIVRKTIERIGYDDNCKGFDHKTCSVMVSIHQQSPEISHSVSRPDGLIADTGAGDQGIMFGYATDETEEAMPLTIMLAHRITAKLAELRRNGQLLWLRPDCKSQVTVEYELDGGATVPLRVHTVVLSTQHSEAVTLLMMREMLLEKVIKAVIPHHLLDDQTIYHIQPSGSFLVGGPQGDAGLTGRKIIVDSYGGWGAHGGGAFSGKDWTKVDRSATYAARWIAKSLVSAKLARRCLIQLSYSIGLPEPLSIYVDTYGTSKLDSAQLVRIINDNFDLRPGSLCRELDLTSPIYERTACYGHFGRPEFTWEIPKKLLLN